MAFNEDKSKHNKVLINIKESKQEAIKIIVGKTGYLFKLKNSNNEYKFIYEENGKRKNFNYAIIFIFLLIYLFISLCFKIFF